MHQTGLIEVAAPRQGLFDITDRVEQWLTRPIRDGLLTLFIQHTSASLLIHENASADARNDLERWMARLAPESADYRHADEGADDMPAHLRAAITATSVAIPIIMGKMALGRWQGIYLFEHRRQPTQRRIALHLAGA